MVEWGGVAAGERGGVARGRGGGGGRGDGRGVGGGGGVSQARTTGPAAASPRAHRPPVLRASNIGGLQQRGCRCWVLQELGGLEAGGDVPKLHHLVS